MRSTSRECRGSSSSFGPLARVGLKESSIGAQPVSIYGSSANSELSPDHGFPSTDIHCCQVCISTRLADFPSTLTNSTASSFNCAGSSRALAGSSGARLGYRRVSTARFQFSLRISRLCSCSEYFQTRKATIVARDITGAARPRPTLTTLLPRPWSVAPERSHAVKATTDASLAGGRP